MDNIRVMIATEGEDKNIIENLVKTYIEKPSCIILLTVACETDWQNQQGYDLAMRYDPDGKRTIGVLTKPDRIPPGEADRWTRYIRNEDRQLANGWFSVKQPNSEALKDGITWEEARRAEREYFTRTLPWSTLPPAYQRHLGTANLTEKLSKLLSSLIANRLPNLQDELQKLLKTTEDALHTLPKPPSEDAFTEMFHLISEFIRDLGGYLDGTPYKDGLLQRIRPDQVAFKNAIRGTAPDFRTQFEAYEDIAPASVSGSDGEGDATAHIRASTFIFLANEEDARDFTPPVDDTNVIWAHEVMQRAEEAITRELPGHYPYIICREYIAVSIKQWHDPTQVLFEAVQRALSIGVKTIIDKHFFEFARGGLHECITNVIGDYITARSKDTHERIMWLLDLERQPTTLHTFYHTNYHDKFIAHFRASHHAREHDGLMHMLEAYDRNPHLNTNFNRSVSCVIAGLREIGIHRKATDLPGLPPTHPQLEPALHIMATVRAYFQVAYKRFVDVVSMAIDHELILGLVRGRGLQSALLKGLGIADPGGMQRCKEYLREPSDIVARRDELQKRLERLRSAQAELATSMWL